MELAVSNVRHAALAILTIGLFAWLVLCSRIVSASGGSGTELYDAEPGVRLVWEAAPPVAKLGVGFAVASG